MWREEGATRTFAKGSQETIVDLASPDVADREAALVRVAELASSGRRVVAVAAGPAGEDGDARSEDERELRYLGLLAFADPLRPGVTASLETTLALMRGLALTAGVLALFLASLPGEMHARTLAVTALVVGQTLLVLTARAGSLPVWRSHLRNPILPAIIGFSIASVAAVPVIPPLAELMRMRPLTTDGWALALAVAGLAVIGPEVLKLARWTRPARTQRP